MAKPTEKKSGAFWVGLGIFLSRIAGLVREMIFAHFFGNSEAADAFKAALKIPNFLQNLLGEGVLSASFIPVYAQLHSQNKTDEADRVAKSVGVLLFLLSSTLAIAGILLAPYLISIIAPGFEGAKAALTIHLVQIFFPAIAVLVQSAWCLGILNSHRKFFLSYVAPVASNAALIGVLLYFGPHQESNELAVTVAWGFGLGAIFQLLVQLPSTLRLLANWRPHLDLACQSTQRVLANFLPVLTSRGVVQISAYIDSMIASLMPTGSVSALSYSQILYLLPISLFGMSVSAAELPEMSSAQGDARDVAAFLKTRLERGFRKIAFFVVPTFVAFIALGDVLISAIFQSGEFTRNNTHLVWYVLAASSVGLVAGTQGRLISSTYYALKDTRSPLKFAMVRVFLTTVLGVMGAPFVLEPLGIPLWLGPVILSVGFGIAAWAEFLLLRRGLARKIGALPSMRGYEFQLLMTALVAALVAFIVKTGLSDWHRLTRAVIVCGLYGTLYLSGCALLRVPELDFITQRIASLKRKGK